MKFLIVLWFLITSLANASYVQSPFPVSKGGTHSASQVSNRVIITNTVGDIVNSPYTSDVEISYVKGVTSAIQTQINGLQTAGNYITALTGEVTASGPGSSAATVTNSAVIGKVITGYSSGAGTVASTDTILQAVNKLNGNDALKLATASFTDAAVTGKLITGYVSGSGTVSATDTILQAIQKLNGNIAALPGANISVVDGGNAAYNILAGNRHVRSTTTLTAQRAYTLPVCDASNIGEQHEVKNLPAQTFNIVLTANGSDLIDGAATVTVLPGDSIPVVCAAFSSVGTWDIQ